MVDKVRRKAKSVATDVIINVAITMVILFLLCVLPIIIVFLLFLLVIILIVEATIRLSKIGETEAP